MSIDLEYLADGNLDQVIKAIRHVAETSFSDRRGDEVSHFQWLDHKEKDSDPLIARVTTEKYLKIFRRYTDPTISKSIDDKLPWARMSQLIELWASAAPHGRTYLSVRMPDETGSDLGLRELWQVIEGRLVELGLLEESLAPQYRRESNLQEFEKYRFDADVNAVGDYIMGTEKWRTRTDQDPAVVERHKLTDGSFALSLWLIPPYPLAESPSIMLGANIVQTQDEDFTDELDHAYNGVRAGKIVISGNRDGDAEVSLFLLRETSRLRSFQAEHWPATRELIVQYWRELISTWQAGYGWGTLCCDRHATIS